MNTKQHPPNTILPQHDWLKTRQCPQNTVWPRYDWLQSRSAYQNKAVRPEVSKGEHLIFFNMETVEEIEALQAAPGESA
jgi:hypothetical protein